MRFILLAAAAALLIGAGSAVAGPPEDAAAYHLITVTQSPPSAKGLRLIDSLQSNAKLARIAGSCKRFTWTPADELYRNRYAAALPPTTLPIVALVRSDGGVIYKASGHSIPDGDALAESLMGAAFWDRQDNPRPIPSTLPASIAADYDDEDPASGPLFPNRPRVVDLIPDTVTVSPTVNVPDAFAWVAGGVALFVVAAGGLVLLCVLLGVAWVVAKS